MLATTDHIEARDAGPKAGGTERLCVVARVAKPVDDLLRFVAGPDGTLAPDIRDNRSIRAEREAQHRLGRALGSRDDAGPLRPVCIALRSQSIDLTAP